MYVGIYVVKVKNSIKKKLKKKKYSKLTFDLSTVFQNKKCDKVNKLEKIQEKENKCSEFWASYTLDMRPAPTILTGCQRYNNKLP